MQATRNPRCPVSPGLPGCLSRGLSIGLVAALLVGCGGTSDDGMAAPPVGSAPAAVSFNLDSSVNRSARQLASA